MAKWLKIGNTYFNLIQIRQIKRMSEGVYIDGTLVANFENEGKAEQYIKDFIAEHYIQTGKIA